MKRLTFAAPRRMWIQAANGQWFSQEWTAAGVREALDGGAWFKPSGHDFASKEVAALAVGKSLEGSL